MDEKTSVEDKKKSTLYEKSVKAVPLILPYSCALLGLFFLVDFIISRYYFIKYDRIVNLSDINDYSKFCISFVLALFVKKGITKFK